MKNEMQLRNGNRARGTRNPFAMITQMQRQMDSMFNSLLRDEAWELPSFSSTGFWPAYDLADKGSHYVMSVAAPGLTKADLKVELVGDQLHVFGEQRHEKETERKGGTQSESFFGAVDHWLSLPEDAKPEGIQASIKDGIVEIALQKAEAAKPKQIEITEGPLKLQATSQERKSA